MARVTGTSGKDFIHRAGDGKVVPAGYHEIASVTLGADLIEGKADDDILFGDAGNDYLDGGAGADVMNGGSGNDVYYVDTAADQVNEAANQGFDVVYSAVDYALAAGQAVEELVAYGDAAQNGVALTGNELDNILVGKAGQDALTGGAGNDRLDGGAGADIMTGGSGNDVYYVDAAADQVNEAANQGFDVVYSAVDYALAAGQAVEELVAYGNAAQNGVALTGNELDNILIGGAGQDTLTGGAGNDRLDGGAGADVMTGGSGNDVYYVDTAADQVSEAANQGFDVVYSTVAYALAAGEAIEELVAYGNAAKNGVALTGNERDNILIGGAGQDTLTGGAGNDRLDGGAGVDVMVGGSGNDVYYVDTAADQVMEAAGGGNDTVYASVGFALAAGQEIENLKAYGAGAASGITLTGNEFGNYLVGGAGNDTLIGGRGADKLDGGAGFDVASYANASAAVQVDIAAGRGLGQVGDAAGDVYWSIEGVIGSSFGDYLYNGNGAAPASIVPRLLDGAGGNDSFAVYGADTLADTTVRGGDGSDSLYIHATSGDLSIAGVTGVEAYFMNPLGPPAGPMSLTLHHENFAGVVGNTIAVHSSENSTVTAILSPGDKVDLSLGDGSTGIVSRSTLADATVNGLHATLVVVDSGVLDVAGVHSIGTIRLASTGVNTLTLQQANFSNQILTVFGGDAGNIFDASAATHVNDFVNFYGGAGTDSFIGSHSNQNEVHFSAAGMARAITVQGNGVRDLFRVTDSGIIDLGKVSGFEVFSLADGDNSLTLRDKDFIGVTDGTIRVDLGSSGRQVLDASSVSAGNRLEVFAYGGGDAFSLDVVGGAGDDYFDAFLLDTDVIRGGLGNDELNLEDVGAVHVAGVSGIETWRLNDAADVPGRTDIRLSLVDANFDGVTDRRITVLGGTGGLDNTIDASAVTAANRLIVVGNEGKDIFTGGAGNDLFRFDEIDGVSALSNSDVVRGGLGTDVLEVLSYGPVPDVIAAAGVSGVEVYDLVASSGFVLDSLTLHDANFVDVANSTIRVFGEYDELTLDASTLTGANRVDVDGGHGHNVLKGGAGDDVFRLGSFGGSLVDGGAGNDELIAGGRLDISEVRGIETYRMTNANLALADGNFAGVTGSAITVIGGDSADTIGEAGVSASNLAVLQGGAGDDTLIAGLHATLTGGDGADLFRFATPGTLAIPDANLVTDFSHGVDRLCFSDAGFDLGQDEGKGTATPQLISALLFSAAMDGTFQDPGNRFAYDSGSGGLFYDADGSGGGFGRQLIATLTGHPSLSASDLSYVA